MVVYLNKIFFIKATKAAGQSRLSKFEDVECSKIGHLWPYQPTLPAVYQLTLHGQYDENMDVLAKLMDYMTNTFNTLKANIKPIDTYSRHFHIMCIKYLLMNG